MDVQHVLTTICVVAMTCAGCATGPQENASASRGSATVAPQSPRTPPTRLVTRQMKMPGYGKVFYDADVCELSFSVVTVVDANLSESFDEHRKETADISAFMQGYGGTETICAAKATVLRRHEDRVGPRLVEEYRYQTDYSCRFAIKEEVALVQKELVMRGVNQISAMELRSSKYNELLKEARDLALADARAKVEYIARATGWEIVELTDVGLEGENVRSRLPGATLQYGARARRVEDDDSPFETYIDATIQATFLLRRKET